jgi:hypothetical protein
MFNYNLASSDSAIVLISKVRLELGDTVRGTGILPSGANLQDEEISLYLTAYDNDIAQTVGALAGVLSRHWAGMADVAVGPRKESLSQVAEAWTKHANAINPDQASFVIDPGRTDGYSEA